MIEHPHDRFAVFVGHVENGRAARLRGLGQRQRAAARPRRGRQDAVDGHARQRPGAGCRLKLDTLAKTGGDDAFDMPFPPHGEKKRMPSVVSAFAQVVRWRVEQLEAGLKASFP